MQKHTKARNSMNIDGFESEDEPILASTSTTNASWLRVGKQIEILINNEWQLSTIMKIEMLVQFIYFDSKVNMKGKQPRISLQPKWLWKLQKQEQSQNIIETKPVVHCQVFNDLYFRLPGILVHTQIMIYFYT